MKSILLAMLLSLAGGCVGSGIQPFPPAPVLGRVGDAAPPAETAASSIEAVEARVRTLHKLMAVQVTLASEVGRDIRFEYSTRWYDTAGMLIPSFTGSWFAGEIPNLCTAIIFEMAPSPDAAKLEIVCREISTDDKMRTYSQPLLLCYSANSQ